MENIQKKPFQFTTTGIIVGLLIIGGTILAPFALNAGLGSPFGPPPAEPTQGTGLAIVKFFDEGSINNTQLNGTFDLVIIENETLYLEDANTSQEYDIEVPVYIVVKTVDGGDAPYGYYSETVSLEARDDEAYTNFIGLTRKANTTTMSFDFVNINNLYGTYSATDISQGSNGLIFYVTIPENNPSGDYDFLYYGHSSYRTNNTISDYEAQTLEGLSQWEGLWIAIDAEIGNLTIEGSVRRDSRVIWTGTYTITYITPIVGYSTELDIAGNFSTAPTEILFYQGLPGDYTSPDFSF